MAVTASVGDELDLLHRAPRMVGGENRLQAVCPLPTADRLGLQSLLEEDGMLFAG